jgi:uncharacterized membrane protein YphA (DoxX/SURF4 family)
MDQLLREPVNAAIAAAAITVGYVYIKNSMNGGEKLKNSDYFKPAFLVAILVYFLTSKAHGTHESRMTEPF